MWKSPWRVPRPLKTLGYEEMMFSCRVVTFWRKERALSSLIAGSPNKFSSKSWMTYTRLLTVLTLMGEPHFLHTHGKAASCLDLLVTSKICPVLEQVGGWGDSSDFSSWVDFEVHNFSIDWNGQTKACAGVTIQGAEISKILTFLICSGYVSHLLTPFAETLIAEVALLGALMGSGWTLLSQVGFPSTVRTWQRVLYRAAAFLKCCDFALLDKLPL